MRVCYLLHRLISGESALSGYDVLKLATRGGARLLGRTDIGHLAVGMCADFFLVDSRRIELTGASESPEAMLATVGLKGAVDYTFVGGRMVVRNGRLCNADEEAISRESALKLSRYWSA